MTYFLSERPLAPGDLTQLEGEEARHAADSRRLRPGEELALQDPQGHRFRAVVEGRAGRRLRVRIVAPAPVPALPSVRVTLLQGAVKPKAAEWIIQKATELGVAEVRFFPTLHSTLSPRELRPERTRERWLRIAWEACKQCDRQFPPHLAVESGLEAALADPPAPPEGAEWRWLLHPTGAAVPAGAAPSGGQMVPRAARLLVGPEGGFAKEEIERAQAAGFLTVRLGELVLRAETAALAACALVLYGR